MPLSLSQYCILHVLLFVLLLSRHSTGLNITGEVFEGDTNGLLAAFGDFNSDKLTDVFVLHNSLHSFSVFLAYSEPPFLRKGHIECSLENEFISNLVPGDFDGDGAMDVLVVARTKRHGETYKSYVAWGSLTNLECPKEGGHLLETHGEPLALDQNSDMISDLFGLDINKTRQFWIFNTSKQIERTVTMESQKTLRIPHSHGFLDLNGDSSADLLLTGEESFEVWTYVGTKGFELKDTIRLPVSGSVIGQSLFLDFNFDGKLDHLVPVCVDWKCQNSSFYMYSDNDWHAVPCDLQDPAGNIWTFPIPNAKEIYFEALTARSGDFNLDGYPDLIMTITRGDQMRAIILENVPSESGTRKFLPRWDLLPEWNTSSVMATMYDIQEKGILDVLLVHRTPEGQFRMAAAKNTLDYDANFIKVLVLTGRCYTNCSHGNIPYGTNLPGPSISYRTTQPTGEPQLTCSAQLSQSAYHALQLPYTLLGLARSPNFLEALHDLVAAVNRKEAFQFDQKNIPTPVEVNTAQDADTNRTAINRDIKISEIHDIFLDRTLSANRVTEENLCTAFCEIAWSPSGLLPKKNWSHLFTGSPNWAWFLTLQRSGHLVLWKAIAPLTKLKFAGYHDLQLKDPSTMKVCPGASDNEFLLFAGSHGGAVKCWLVSWKENEDPTCKLLDVTIAEDDFIPVLSIEVDRREDHEIVSFTKSNALVAVSLKWDGNSIQLIDQGFVQLPSLQITGITKLIDGKILCCTEDFQIYEIDLSSNKSGTFKGLQYRKLQLPIIPTMLCRGIGTCYPNNGRSFVVLESTKVAFDHLRCRQPSSLTVYVDADCDRVTGFLERATSMRDSVLALETYKALNSSWENIWEIDYTQLNNEDNYYLQLLRWFALYKCNACFVERRYDKEYQDDLKSRAEKAELHLQLRHAQNFLMDRLNHQEFNPTSTERSLLSLACHFMSLALFEESEFSLDRSLVTKIKEKYRLDADPPNETCPICEAAIAFEKHQEAKCSNGHRTLIRCRATLRACYAETLSCRWCGAHYHQDSEIETCILCGGLIK
nr:EOG090X03KG [Macrothrix elegans]